MKPIRLMTVAPGHFHAALVQQRMTPGVARKCYVYAPLDADLVAHLDHLARFNARPAAPTAWALDVRAGEDYRERFLREQPGNVVVLSGRNRPKIDLMLAAVENNLHVVADKPWVVEHADFPKVEQLLREAEFREVLAWDVMTERHEVMTRLQRELVRDREVFGGWQAGTPDSPALTLESVHALKKAVAGRPLLRPWWWFDAATSGEAMADVGTHLADLALWLVCPDVAVDYRTDVAVVDADRWPLILSREQFAGVTGLPDYPPELAARAIKGQLYYAGNNTATVQIRGAHVRLGTLWEYTLPGGDTHHAAARGVRSTVVIRQSADAGGVPELMVVANDPADGPDLAKLLHDRCKTWQRAFPGVAAQPRGPATRLVVPDALRTGHEAHFAEVLEEFVRYFHTPRAVPAWEAPNTLAKYYITTKAVELARQRRPW